MGGLQDVRIHYYVYLHFRMSLFENNSAEGDLVKLHTADHNMNSPAGAEQSKHFPYSAFPSFPFLPAPLSLNLTGQLGQSSPSSAQAGLVGEGQEVDGEENSGPIEDQQAADVLAGEDKEEVRSGQRQISEHPLPGEQG